MTRNKKVITTVALVLILGALLFAGYNIYAKSTNEMLSKGDGLPASYPYVTYEDLINERDTLCCGKGVPLPGRNSATVTSGGETTEEPYLTMNDIGKKIFKKEQSASGGTTSDNFTNPYTATRSKTLPVYKESGMHVASPEEAYVLAEISENYPGGDSTFYNKTNEEYTGSVDNLFFMNINGEVLYAVETDTNSLEPTRYAVKDEESGRYYYVEITDSGRFYPYTYVQYAWWRTNAGGNAAVEATPLSQEAEAFEEYINKVAKRDGNGNIVYEQRTVTVRGETATIQAPVIDYKVTGEDSNKKVEYDEDHGKYLIGPFKINYYEESVTTSRGTVHFSHIIDAKVVSNLGEVSKDKWFFKYANRSDDDKAAFPHNGEEFYLVLDYIEGMRYLEDIHFDFEYMNAGGNYTKLTGTFFEVDWEPHSEAEWCNEGATNCPCGGYHTSAQYDADGNMTCAGGAKRCSHGYYHNHIVKWNYWLEVEGMSEITSQPLAQVYVGVRWYEKAEFSFNAELPGKSKKEYIRLTIPMEGEVWIDQVPDKKNPEFKEGTKEAGDKGYKNAEVYIYKVFRKDGEVVKRQLADVFEEDNKTKIKYPIYTDANGKYKVPNINVPGVEVKKDGKPTDESIPYLHEGNYDVSYDVEFKFDGQHYEVSKALATSNGDANAYIKADKAGKKAYEKDSIASENAQERDAYNKKFTETYGGKAIDGSGNTVGYSKGGEEVLKLDYTSKEFSLPNNVNKRRLSKLTVLDSQEHIIEQYKMRATTGNTGIYYPVDNKISVDSADDVIELSVVENEKGRNVTYKTIYDYMMHINLAVKEREKTDLSLFKDLYKAEILVNEKEITKTYNKYIDVEEKENREALETQIEACRIGKYTLGLYSSDYEYRSTVYEKSEDVVKKIKADTDLKLYLTYRIAINNESEAEKGLDATINQINDYYDKTFTLVNEDITANVLKDDPNAADYQNRIQKVVAEKPYYRIVKADEVPKYTYWSNGMSRFTCNDTNTQVNNDYKKLTITALKNVKLAVGEQLEMFITFEVDKNGYKNPTDRPDLLGDKNNVAEIANYSTFYKNGKVAGIIDRDSAPDNIDLNRNVKEWYEDDTESAPTINIHLYNYNREINGNVWEEAETKELLYGQKVGDGLMDESENKVPHIDALLVEKIQIDGVEYEKIWTEDDFNDLTAEERKIFRLKDVETDENGYYYFQGVLAGNYVVRFKYGNKEANVRYNGQDYKNTAYQADMKNSDGTATLNNEWQDLRASTLNATRVSDARDYELQRMKVIAYSQNINNHIGNALESADDSIKNHDELIANTQMVANTAKMNIEIEHQDFINYGEVNTVNGIQEYTYYVRNIDFGLERRSPTVIELNKRLSRIQLLKDNGTTVIMDVSFNEDGTVNTESKDSKFTRKLTHVSEIPNIQGLEYIPIESSFLTGTTLKIEYKIKVTNRSEVDWTGKIADFVKPEDIVAEVAMLETTEPYVSGEMIEYGDYVGLNYYTNNNSDTDKIVKTKVTSIVDYVDNDMSPDENAIRAIEDSSWRDATLDELVNGEVIDQTVYTDGKLLDSRGREYIAKGKSNIQLTENEDFNPSIIRELVPEAAAEGDNVAYTGEIRFGTIKNLSSDISESDIYDNIAEIVSYFNTVGRRDENAVPANAQVARGEYTAAHGVKDGAIVTDYLGGKEVEKDGEILHLNGERDTDAPNFVTLTEPTGISTFEANHKNFTIVAIISGVTAGAVLIYLRKRFK